MKLPTLPAASWLLIVAVNMPLATAQETSPVILRNRPAAQRFTSDQVEAAGTGLPTWIGKFSYKGKNYHYTMVGSDPSKGSTTTVPVYIVPLKLTFSDGTVFDASTDMINETISATEAVIESPIFQSAPFTEGTIDVGTTQYIDAFMRANFWDSVSVNTGYHMLVGNPTVLPVQAYTVPKGSGSTMAGPVKPYKRGTLDQNFIDDNITPEIFKAFPQITPGTFTIFLTYNVFPGGAYGYHDVYGGSSSTGLTYAYVSYLEPYVQLIDADISTLAHEVAEWTDDPYISNETPCGILEVGDPLNYAIFEIDLNGMVWHPQDLAFVGYFFQTPIPSVNGWLTFKNTYMTPCANGS
jgi:hypothetical protein